MENTQKKKKKLTKEDMYALLDELYSKVNTGLPGVSQSVTEMADDYLKKNEDEKKAIKKMHHNQIAKCTTSGFITPPHSQCGTPPASAMYSTG